jgi:hypothetical protein
MEINLFLHFFHLKSKDKCYSSKVGVKNLLMGKKLLNFCVLLPSLFELKYLYFSF